MLTAQHIVKSFGSYKALDDVSIDVKDHSIFGLLGPNGAGKTTLLRIINYILRPDEGSLFLDGKPMNYQDILQIGYLPEERGLYKKMKVGEQALYLAQLKGLSKVDAIRRLKQWFEKMGIEDWWNRKVEELSKGMQQKVQFIVTVLHQPKLLIFDEPFSGFDPVNANLLKEEILNLRNQGATVIFSTHNMASVEELCDDIALINKSQVVLSGSMRSIKDSYRQNRYRIECTDFSAPISLPDSFEISNPIYTTDNKASFEVQLPLDANPNHLFALLQNQCTLRSLNEILPTMNDIFLQSVGAQHK